MIAVLLATGLACGKRVSPEVDSAAPVAETLPGPELRARLDALATCWERVGPATRARPWGRTGGLCQPTFYRSEDTAGALWLGLMFPQGPEGPIRATEGFANFLGHRDDVTVTLFVRVASPTAAPVARLEVGSGSGPVATLPLARSELARIETEDGLADALRAAIDEEHDPAKTDMSQRQDCRVLPNRGQFCQQVPTTPEDRARMTASLAAEAQRKRDWLTKNAATVHALRAGLYPLATPECAALAVAAGDRSP